MAINFRIHARETGDQSMDVRLFGDFDASSACELINVLDERVRRTGKVAIDTDGLRTVNAFGLEVFVPEMTRMQNKRADIEVTGRFSEAFREL